MTYDEHQFFRHACPSGVSWQGEFTLGAGLAVDKQQMRAQMIMAVRIRLERVRNADASVDHYVPPGVIPALATRLRRMQLAYKAAAKRLAAKGQT